MMPAPASPAPAHTIKRSLVYIIPQKISPSIAYNQAFCIACGKTLRSGRGGRGRNLFAAVREGVNSRLRIGHKADQAAADQSFMRATPREHSDSRRENSYVGALALQSGPPPLLLLVRPEHVKSRVKAQPAPITDKAACVVTRTHADARIRTFELWYVS